MDEEAAANSEALAFRFLSRRKLRNARMTNPSTCRSLLILVRVLTVDVPSFSYSPR